MRKQIDHTGLRVGLLTVVSKIKNTPKWLCKCDCGTNKEIHVSHILSGRQKSCGCINKKPRNPRKTKPMNPISYDRWRGMKSRCYNKNAINYKYYGGRGIEVCSRWHNYEAFLLDMGEPTECLSLERIDNNGPYSPENCRWATQKEQNRNTRSNVFITINNETKCMAEWAECFGIKKATLFARIKRGWSIEKALNTPLRYNYK